MGRSNPAGGSTINSIQKGYIQIATTTNGATKIESISISAVDRTKSFIYANRSTSNAFGYGVWQNTLFSESHVEHPDVYFTSDTTIECRATTRNFTYGYNRAYVAWQVIEYR